MGIRICFVLCLLLAVSVVASRAEESLYRSNDARTCPILDAPLSLRSGLDVGYVLEAGDSAPVWGDLSTLEINAWVRFAHLENRMGGDFELLASYDAIILRLSDQEDPATPLHSVALPIRWSQRYESGFGMQLEAFPGLYTSSDYIDDAFAVPCGARLIKAFSGNTAIFLGAHVYPGFDQEVDPWGGLHWSWPNVATVELAYPETRLSIGSTDGLRLVVGGRIVNWYEYSLGDDDTRGRIHYDETRVFAGLNWAISAFTELGIRGGYVMDRTIGFEQMAVDIDLDKATFFSVGIRGRL